MPAIRISEPVLPDIELALSKDEPSRAGRTGMMIRDGPRDSAHLC